VILALNVNLSSVAFPHQGAQTQTSPTDGINPSNKGAYARGTELRRSFMAVGVYAALVAVLIVPLRSLRATPSPMSS
jgi:hypothetical protein